MSLDTKNNNTNKMACHEAEIPNNSEMVECPLCHHLIPEANTQLHEASCNNRLHGLDNIRMESNYNSSSTVEQSPCIDLSENDELMEDSERDHLEMVSRSWTNGQDMPDEETCWPCPRCTLLNANSSTHCDACNYARDQFFRSEVRSPDPTRREQLVIDLTQSPPPQQHTTVSSPSTCDNGHLNAPPSTTSRQQGIILAGGALIGSVFGGASALLQGHRFDQGLLQGAATGAATGVIISEFLRPQPSPEPERLPIHPLSVLTSVTSGTSLPSPTTTSIPSSTSPHPNTPIAPPMARVVTLVPATTITVFTDGRNGVDVQDHDRLVRTIMSGLLVRDRTGSPSYEQMLEMFGDGMENRGADAALISRLPVSTVENPHLLPEDCRACSVCLSNYDKGDKRKLLPCLHGFHQDCIDTWLGRCATCPVCKFDLK